MVSLHRLLDNARVAVLALDQTGSYIYENDAAKNLLGYEPNEIAQKHITDLVQLVPSVLSERLETIKIQRHRSGRVVFRTKSGEMAKVAFNVFAHTLADGNAIYVSILHSVPLDSPDLTLDADAARQFGLTAREMRLLYLMSEGFADKQIADFCRIRPGTVSREIGAILRKMKASSRTQACVIAIKAQVIL